MTTFEIIVTVAIIAIVVLLVWLIHRINKVNGRYEEQFDLMCETLSDIRGDTVDIIQELDNIEGNILDGLRDMNSQSICWSELTDDQKSEILYRLTHPVVESPFKPPFNPTCETTNKEK